MKSQRWRFKQKEKKKKNEHWHFTYYNASGFRQTSEESYPDKNSAWKALLASGGYYRHRTGPDAGRHVSPFKVKVRMCPYCGQDLWKKK